jgi:hypothetical protein
MWPILHTATGKNPTRHQFAKERVEDKEDGERRAEWENT